MTGFTSTLMANLELSVQRRDAWASDLVVDLRGVKMELKTTLVAATASIALALSGAAHAATIVFDSTFENLPGGPTPGTFTTPATADG